MDARDALVGASRRLRRRLDGRGKGAAQDGQRTARARAGAVCAPKKRRGRQRRGRAEGARAVRLFGGDQTAGGLADADRAAFRRGRGPARRGNGAAVEHSLQRARPVCGNPGRRDPRRRGVCESDAPCADAVQRGHDPRDARRGEPMRNDAKRPPHGSRAVPARRERRRAACGGEPRRRAARRGPRGAREAANLPRAARDGAVSSGNSESLRRAGPADGKADGVLSRLGRKGRGEAAIVRHRAHRASAAVDQRRNRER